MLALLFGGNILGGGDGGGPLSPGGVDETVPSAPSGAAPGDKNTGGSATTKDDALEFAKFVSNDTQDMWTQVFQQSGKQYTRAPVVIFTSGTMSGCGPASSSTGPFYCPADHKVYLDLSFFQELSRRFGAPGDFAAAYVIAHEIGHHIQSELGIEEQIRRKQQEDPSNANKYSVQLELQADCFAGVWGKSTYDRGLLDPGDVEEGLKAAAAVGDDRLGARSREQWTHGSSALRCPVVQDGVRLRQRRRLRHEQRRLLAFPGLRAVRPEGATHRQPLPGGKPVSDTALRRRARLGAPRCRARRL